MSDDVRAAAERAWTLGRLGRLHEAIDILGQQLVENPTSPQLLVALSACEHQLRLGDEALRHARDAVRQAPDWPQPYWALGAALMLSGSKLSEARDAFAHAAALDPHDARSYLPLGEAELALGNTAAAWAALEQAERLSPDENSGPLRIKLQLLDDRANEALVTADTVLKNVPEEAAALLNRSAVLSRLGRLEEALEMAQAAASLAPTGAGPGRVDALELQIVGRALKAAASADDGVARLQRLADRLDRSGDIFLAAWFRVQCGVALREAAGRNDPGRRTLARRLSEQAVHIPSVDLSHGHAAPFTEVEEDADLVRRSRQVFARTGVDRRREILAGWHLGLASELIREPRAFVSQQRSTFEEVATLANAACSLASTNRSVQARAHLLLGSSAKLIADLTEAECDAALLHLDTAATLFGQLGHFNQWALVQTDIATTLWARSDSTGQADHFRAIDACERALSVPTYANGPDAGWLHMRLGQLYGVVWRQGWPRSKATRRETLATATRHLEVARETLPAHALQNRAVATSTLVDLMLRSPYPGRSERIDRAVHLLDEVSGLQEAGYEREHQTLQATRARVLSKLPLGDHAQNMEQALALTQQLAGLDQGIGLSRWRFYQTLLADMYVDRVLGDQEENLRKAVQLARASAETLNDSSGTHSRQDVNFQLARMLRDAACVGEPAWLREATVLLEQLTSEVEAVRPAMWRAAIRQLGHARRDADSSSPSALQSAIGCYEAALAAVDEEDDPWLAAGLQGNIGKCSALQAELGVPGARERALSCLDRALAVITSDECPWLHEELLEQRNSL